MKNDILAKNIKNIRIQSGLTMEEFGKKIDNAHKSLVSKWEKGMSIPSSNRLKLISELGEMSVEELLYGNENFQSKLKRLRNENNITTSELAKKLDIDEKELLDIENSRFPYINNELINKIAEFFNIDVSYLVGTNNIFFKVDSKIEDYLHGYFYLNPPEELLQGFISEKDIDNAYFQAINLSILYSSYLLNDHSLNGKSFEDKMNEICERATTSVIYGETYSNKGAINFVINRLSDLAGELEVFFYEYKHVSDKQIAIYKKRKDADEQLFKDLKNIVDESLSKAELIKKYYNN